MTRIEWTIKLSEYALNKTPVGISTVVSTAMHLLLRTPTPTNTQALWWYLTGAMELCKDTSPVMVALYDLRMDIEREEL